MSAVYRVLSGVNVSKKELDEAARLANLALSEFNQADITDPQLRYRHQLECYMLLGKIYSKQGTCTFPSCSYKCLTFKQRRMNKQKRHTLHW